MNVDGLFLAGQLRYSRWASLKLVSACDGLGRDELRRLMYTSCGSLFGTLVHIYMGDAFWLERLRGTPKPIAPAEPADLGGLRQAWTRTLDELIAFAEALPDVTGDVQFELLNGTIGSLPVWQVVLHVVNHASFHRGQVVTLLRQLGHAAVGTDMDDYFRGCE